MNKAKRQLKKFLALFLSILVITQLLCLPVSAMTNSDETVITPNSNLIQGNNEDSTFILANSNVQISDDYLPETAYISEVEASLIEQDDRVANAQLDGLAGETVGDPMVYYTQKWLNQEYGNVPGFGSVPENGKTGWPTVYGLLRALQHELGITSLADSFGPTTSRLYEQNILRRQDGVKNRKFAILQGALWCKGYNPGYNIGVKDDGTVVFRDVFDEDVENAVIQLKKDAGFSSPNGEVTLNVMKALMSMDSFKLLSSYGGKPEIRTMQQKLNRKYEAYTGLNPCDGVYGRNTNKALIYALQAEEGLPIEVANGNLGVTTQLCCPEIPYFKNSTAARRYPGTSAGAYYTANQISSFTELLQFALFVNGVGNGNIDGFFDSETQQDLRTFQQKYAIPITGKATKGTWLSLFISCGDVARPALACDCATILTPAKAQTLYNNGYRYVGRYLTGTYNGGISKAITKDEAQIIFDTGLKFFPIYQTSARSDTYFTEAQGTADANAAIEAALALGVPRDTIIYFAVDFDAMDYQITSNVIPYFKKVHEEMSGSIYRTGIYGTRNVCNRVSALGYTCSSFVGDMSTGFSGNLGYSMPDDWAFDQFKTVSLGSGDGYIEIDKDGFSGHDQGVSKLESVNIPTVSGSDFNTGFTQSDTVYGPTVNILGFEFPLFALDIGINFPNNILVESNYDKKEEQLNVIIGVDLYQYSLEKFGIREKPEGEKYKQAFVEVKQMVSSIGKNNQEFSNRFSGLKSSLYDKGLKFGFDCNAYLVGYMTIDCKTGTPILTVGEMGLIGTMNGTWSYPTPIPCVYTKLEIEGSLETGFKLVWSPNGKIYSTGHIKFAVKPSLGVGVDVLVASAYAGISGELECEIKFGSEYNSLRKALECTLNASVFFEYNALLWGNRWDWVFAETQLYPSEEFVKNLSMSSRDLKFIQPIPQTIETCEIGDPNVFQQNMQVYCKPKVISLGNGKMFMVYISDALNRTPENRTALMFSIFNGTTWSTPQSVLDDGTADFEPVICPDGNGGAHILWQNATETFNTGVTLEEMSTAVDLQYTHWNGSSFDSTSAITKNNTNLETAPKIAALGNNISVVWEQNSENDPMGLSGTNSIYRKQFSNGIWENTETLASGLQVITSMDTAYAGSDNIVAYTTKSSNDLSTVNDLEVFYFDGTQTLRITDDDIPDNSVSLLNNELYWISGNSVVSITDGDLESKTTVVENLGVSVSEIKAIKNSNDRKAVVWEEENNFGMNFYGVNYNKDTDSFNTTEPLSAGNGVVRGWDACMMSNGQIEMAYCFAENLDEPTNGRAYGRIDLIQKSVNKFYNISVNPFAAYDGEVKAGQKIKAFAKVYNSGSLPVSQFDIKIFGKDNSVLQTLTIDKNLAVGENAELEIPFTLPSVLTRSDYKVEILPHDGVDTTLSDNETTFSIGFADLVIKDVQEIRVDNRRQLKVTVKNQGFDSISSATLKLLEASVDGEILDNKNISQLEPEGEIELTFNIDDSTLDSSISEAPSLFYLLLETSEDESDYANNSQEIYVYPDYSLNLTAGTGGTVQGSGKFQNDSLALISAIPNSGYIFDGWYENGQKIYGISQYYVLTVKSNRTLEAKFKPNDLKISELEVFGALQKGEPLTITAFTEGGTSSKYTWTFYVYCNGLLCYSNLNSDMDAFVYTPQIAGTYMIMAYATDEAGFRVSSAKQFTVV